MFKGQYHEMDIFDDLNILISTFCACADCFQGLSKAFHYPLQLLTFHLLLRMYRKYLFIIISLKK